MATEPNRQMTFQPSSLARMNVWHDATLNAVYLLGSLLFLAGEMQTGSMLFIAGSVASLLRLLASRVRQFGPGMLHKVLPLLLYLVGSCFYYVRDVPTGTFLFIAGSIYALATRIVPAVRKREIGQLGALIPLALSLLGCFFFLSSVRIFGTLLFIVSNAILLHRSLHLLEEAYSAASPDDGLSEETGAELQDAPDWVTLPALETMAQLHQ